MPLTKTNVNINFGQGIDTKTDPKQVTLGKFLDMQNSRFSQGGALKKRNGNGQLTSLPNTTFSLIETFQNHLTAIGTELEAYTSTGEWVTRGDIEPLDMSTLALIRSNTNQSQVDMAISGTGFICVVYTDQLLTALGTNTFKYSITDAITGQTIVSPITLVNTDPTFGFPRVFLLGAYFIIIYTTLVGGINHLTYIAVNTTNPTLVTSPADITISYSPSTRVNFDASVFNGNLYIAWNGGGGSGIQMAYLTSQLVLSAAINPDPAHTASIMSVTVDNMNQLIWASYYDSGSGNGYAFSVSPVPSIPPAFTLDIITPPTQIISPPFVVLNITSVAQNNVLTFIYEILNNYTYDVTIPTHEVFQNTLTVGGVLGIGTGAFLSVGLASKAFILSPEDSPPEIYCLLSYQSPYQPTYFLGNIRYPLVGQVVAKLAYSNGGGYLTHGLPFATVEANNIQVPYLIRDLVQAANKNTNPPPDTQLAGVYSQTGINEASFTFTSQATITVEIGLNLLFTGGFLWGYDGDLPTENGFFLWPDSIEATWSTTGGSIVAQPDGATNTNSYWYQVTYEWTDQEGLAYRSAPSIPIAVTTTGTGTTGSITINGPMLRLTYKIANPVKIVIYRWSLGQQVYYQTTSIQMPLLNDPTVNSWTFIDTNSDATILGNNILYTTGGVLENIGGPSFDSVFLFDNRLWGILSEEKNTLWFSKQVIQQVPVEMSDLLTLYVAPSIGAQGPTGDLICGSTMDNNLVLFKASGINYINGEGPDNSGASNQYSQPIFVTSTIGCSNQRSIVFQPNGLMFEFSSPSGNQIWLLGRDFSTSFIGADVQGFTNAASVTSSLNIPGENIVKFTMSTGITLVYNYYYEQWNTETKVPAISSTIFQGLHTFINNLGQVFQETPGIYLDGSSPTLMSFVSSWIHLSGLQGYQRAYFFYLLGQYFSPHLLNVMVAYDYESSPSQQCLVRPINFSPTYGKPSPYGQGSPYGGAGNKEQWRIFFQRQRCEAFQITVNELYDPLYLQPAGAGLTLSGINVVVGLKKGYRPTQFTESTG